MTLKAQGPTAERVALASEVARLRAAGLTHREVGESLGISRSYASTLAADPDGSLARARKESYQGVCVDCGGPTTGCEGPGKAPVRCAGCQVARQHAERHWTREAVIDAIRRFAAEHGRPPTSTEWITADPEHGYPPRSSVYRGSWPGAPFAYWADAIEAAGFPRPLKGHYDRGAYASGERRTAVKDYVILELAENGQWIQHPNVQAGSEPAAIETFIASLTDVNGHAVGRYVALAAARFVIRELRPVTTFKAVAVTA